MYIFMVYRLIYVFFIDSLAFLVVVITLESQILSKWHERRQIYTSINKIFRTAAINWMAVNEHAEVEKSANTNTYKHS